MSAERFPSSKIDYATLAGFAAIDAVMVAGVGYLFYNYFEEIALIGLGVFVGAVALRARSVPTFTVGN